MLGALRRGRGTWQGEEHAKGDGEAESISGLMLFASLLGVPPHQQVTQSTWDCFTELHHYQEPLRSVGVQVEMP